MKHKLRSIMTGGLCGFLVFALSLTAYATVQTISVTYDDIKIIVNGEEVQPEDANGNKVEPFIFEGTTYLPLRAIGEALGEEVEWEPETKSVFIGQTIIPDSYGRFSGEKYTFLSPNGWIVVVNSKEEPVLLDTRGDNSTVYVAEDDTITEAYLTSLTGSNYISELGKRGVDVVGYTGLQTPIIFPAANEAELQSFEQITVDGIDTVKVFFTVKKENETHRCYQALSVRDGKGILMQVVTPDGSTNDGAEMLEKILESFDFI